MEESRYSPLFLKQQILEFVGKQPEHVNRFNMLGKAFSVGSFERWLKIEFTTAERALAYRCLDELRSAGLLIATYSQMGPGAEDWVVLSPRGKAAVARGDLDELDKRLRSLSLELVERRQGVWSALYSGEPQARRQAALAARELVKATLDALVPETTEGLKAKIRAAYEVSNSPPSQTELAYVEAEARRLFELNALLSSHGKAGPLPSPAESERALRAAEDSLRWILGISDE
jgi:hypothetical protein